ncbi:MAG: DUF502 domain-containing protein [Parachlamydiaceae bacterium]|nr:DUF502 domain-containing protein [Parachlamydiaceae bacterium]
MIKKYFFTGLILLLPFVFTMLIVLFIVNLLTKPFIATVTALLTHYDIFNKPFLFLSGPTVLILTSKLLVLLFLLVLIFIVGMVGRLFIISHMGAIGEAIIHRIPFVNKIYKAVKDVVSTLTSKKQMAFSSVVLVPFPHSGLHSIGLITRGELPEGSNVAAERVSVFVPGTPNPAMGFMILFKKEDLIHLDIGVDEAVKLIVSCGVINPEFNKANLTQLPQDIAGK